MRAAMLVGPERIEIRDLPAPRPGPGEAVLRVDAATTCGTDVKVFRRGGHPRMLVTPTLFGHEMAGTVVAVGDGVERTRPGQRVAVANSAPCGACRACQARRENLCADLHYLNGAFAEYLLIPRRFVSRSVYPLPGDMALERAALTEPLACVLHGVDACGLGTEPDEVVIYGAGPIGLLFVAALARHGHRPILADPNPGRLQIGAEIGAVDTIEIARGGGQAGRVRSRTTDGAGAGAAVDCTGVPEAWEDAIDSVRAGGTVNLFGGCAPGTRIAIDTHRLHYSEIAVKGVYHHRPATFRRALEMLADPAFPAEALLSRRQPIDEVEAALRAMMRKEVVKVVISGRA